MFKQSLRFAVLILIVLSSVFGQDWAKLHRYENANEELGAPAPGEKRVVFMGNSITESWVKLSPEFFSENNRVGRGISGQTSPQMLLRFRQDVIELNPSVVVILAGTNDIAQNTGSISHRAILGNIISMAELAQANGITVVLSSVLPAKAFRWQPDMKPAEEIIALNKMIKAYAKREGLFYLDYHGSMMDKEGGLKSEYTRDGVHPNKAGYEQMEILAKEMINKALSKN